jgi:hypothetical protein
MDEQRRCADRRIRKICTSRCRHALSVGSHPGLRDGSETLQAFALALVKPLRSCFSRLSTVQWSARAVYFVLPPRSSKVEMAVKNAAG